MASPLDNPTTRRAKALELAVETIRHAQKFTTFEVVHTAALYDSFMASGNTPPPTVEEQPSADV